MRSARTGVMNELPSESIPMFSGSNVINPEMGAPSVNCVGSNCGVSEGRERIYPKNS
jgi:hypothetical protein